jgi:hypothetical protein
VKFEMVVAKVVSLDTPESLAARMEWQQKVRCEEKRREKLYAEAVEKIKMYAEAREHQGGST